MAAVASETVSIVINDVEIEVPKGELIVESVKRLGLEIPIFCYHPRMKPVGMCRMCIVEVGFKQADGSVRMMPKPQAACTLPAQKDMVVFTDSEMVHRDRRGVLEFLLINHPLDCPVCDRGGECPLQNNTLFYGPSTSRFIEVKRHNHKAFPLSKYVTLDLERCIQCGRCVRFTEEISGDAELAFRFRGAEMQPSTFELRDFTSKFSGNVIEICPVGALTNAEYRFRARPWDLQTKPAMCTVCSNGCSTWFDYRVNKMVRINGRTNEAVNEEWTCDRGKFGHEVYNSTQRLTKPLIRRGDYLEECDWPTAYAAILEHFKGGGARVAGLTGSQVSNEGLYLFKKLFQDVFQSPNLDHRRTAYLQKDGDRLEQKLDRPQVQSSIESFESKSNVLIFGTSLADDEPILFLRIRKGWFLNGSKVIVAHDSATDADSFAHTVLRYKPGTGHILASALLAAAVEAGRTEVPEPVRASLPALEAAANQTGISADRIREAAALLGENGAVVTTHSLFNQPSGQDTLETLGGMAMCLGMEFNCYALGANDQGAEDLGVLPGEGGLDTHGIIHGAGHGDVDALWLLDCDLNLPGGATALEEVPFLVVQAADHTDVVNYASVVLPMALPAESEGSFTNMERRVQKLDPVLTPPGEAKAAWKILSEVMVRSKPEKPFFNAQEIFAEIGREVTSFAGVGFGERLR